jgi:NADPH:quinone reductase-like Zn-dependent oxidoreductase
MRALCFERSGALSELQLREVPRPVAGPGEVVLEVQAAGVNPSDAKNVLGAIGHATLPRIPGRDYPGVAVDGPADLLGMPVCGTGGDLGFTRDGTHAEFLAVPAAALCVRPERLSAEAMAGAGLAYVTAWAALLDAARLHAGETVVVTGAAGSVGSAAVQVARWAGARVIGAIQFASQHEAVAALGVDMVVNLEHEDLPDAVRAATGGAGASVVVDTVGGLLFEPCLRALARCGRQVAIAAIGEHRVTFILTDFVHRELRLFGVDTLQLDAKRCARILSMVAPGFERGALRPPVVAERYALEEGVLAYERVLSGNVAGKVVLLPSGARPEPKAIGEHP